LHRTNDAKLPTLGHSNKFDGLLNRNFEPKVIEPQGIRVMWWRRIEMGKDWDAT